MAKGLYTNVELIDSIIIDLNSCIKEVADGQYIQACNMVTQMSQKLVNLRNTVDNDLKNREQVIEELTAKLRAAGVEMTKVAPEEFIKPVDSETQGVA